MTSLAGLLAGAEGGYRAPSSDSALYTFVLMRNLRWAPAGRSTDSYIFGPRASANDVPDILAQVGEISLHIRPGCFH